MNIESLLPLFIIVGVLALSFVLEAGIMTAFHLKKFWASLGNSIVLNLLSFLLVYFVARPFLVALHYDIGKPSGLNLHAQVIAFLWWFSVVVEGTLLSLFLREHEKKKIWFSAIVMNAFSFAFLYLFDVLSH